MLKAGALLLFLASCAALSGCTRVQEALMPVPQKINAAFPPSAELRLSQERLTQLLSGDPQAVEAMRTQFDARMVLRALTCSKHTSVSRWSTVDAVRQQPLDRQCFQEQDQALEQYLGARIVGTMLLMPPLRPLVAAGDITSLPRRTPSQVVTANFARDAGVAVLRDGLGEMVAIEIPGGKHIAKLPRASVHDPNSHLAPNGRVLAIRAEGQDMTFYDTETGARLWVAPGVSNLLAWLPELAGLILTHRDGSVILVDGFTGESAPHPTAAKNSTYRAHLPGAGSRVLLGNARSLGLVTHERREGGIHATLVKEYSLSSVYGITSGHLLPMMSGRRVVFASMRDIGWLDLDSGTSGTWTVSPHFGNRFSKLDENRLMLDAVLPGGIGLKPWVFDLGSESIAPAELGGPRGLLIDIGERVGFMRRGDEAWFGDTVKAGEPLALERVLADLDLQHQLAKLQAPEKTAAPPGSTLSPVATLPGLEDLPADARVHIVGVYEGKPVRENTRGVPQDVRVVVRRSAKPIVLVLASYESIRWNVVSEGTRPSAVLLSGYEPSVVTGVGSAPVLRIGSAFAYQPDGAEYQRLRQTVVRYTGTREIRSFQGQYRGSEFSIGGQ